MSDTQILAEVEAYVPPVQGQVRSKRLVGFDLARCFAFFGMVIVNYRYLMGGQSGQPEWLLQVFKVFSGRAAATFVILAGVGLSLFYKAHKVDPAPRQGFAKWTAFLRPLTLVLLISTSWVATDFYVAEKAADRSFSFGPLARTPKPKKDKAAVAPLKERLNSHLSTIRSGDVSTFLKIGMGVSSFLLLVFLAFGHKFRSARGILFKRALFLAAFGYLWYPAWSFDILHFYGSYLLAGCVVLTLRIRWIALLALSILAAAFWRQFTKDATIPFSWVSVWEGWGAAKNLFTSGFHPVLPWLAFLLVGLGLGRLDSSRTRTRLAFIVIGLTMAAGGHLGSEPMAYWLDQERFERVAPESAELVVKEKEKKKRSENRRSSAQANSPVVVPTTAGPTSVPSAVNPSNPSTEPGMAAVAALQQAKGKSKKKGPPAPKPLPLTIPEGFPQDAYVKFLAGVKKTRVLLAKSGPWANRQLRIEEVMRRGKKRPALVMSVSYGDGKPAPTSHARELKSFRGTMRRKVVYNEKEMARDKAKADSSNDSRPPWMRRSRKAWPAAVSIVGIERMMPVKDGAGGQIEVVWDRTWIDALAIRNPTPRQRLSTMTDVDSNGNGPFYMLTAIGTSLTLIGLCLFIGSVNCLQRLIRPFVLTGQMALSLYVGHAAIGFYVLSWIDMRRGEGLPFIAFYVVVCWVAAVAFSASWRAFFKRGPLEYFMRWMTD